MSPPLPSRRVLFVDDDAALIALGERFLKKLGHECEVFAAGHAALERFRAVEFDLVITDLTMPGMDGFEVARQCRELRPEVPIIIATGYNQLLLDDDPRLHCASEVVEKPYSLDTLRQALVRVLGA